VVRRVPAPGIRHSEGGFLLGGPLASVRLAALSTRASRAEPATRGAARVKVRLETVLGALLAIG